MPFTSSVDAGNYLQITGLSANALDADLVPATDVSAFKWISLYIGPDVYSGVLSFQASFDQTTWLDITMLSMTSLDIEFSGQTTSAQSVYVGTAVWFPFFRCRMTSYSSGTATGILSLYRDGLPGLQMMNVSTRLFLGHQFFGLTNNDGTATVAIPAGTATDTVVYNSGTVLLARALVTATGTNSMLIYNNASSPSGTVVGVIPANPTVNGVPYVFKMPCSNGIVVAGNASNPGVTISYSQLV